MQHIYNEMESMKRSINITILYCMPIKVKNT